MMLINKTRFENSYTAEPEALRNIQLGFLGPNRRKGVVGHV